MEIVRAINQMAEEAKNASQGVEQLAAASNEEAQLFHRVVTGAESIAQLAKDLQYGVSRFKL